MAEVLSANIEKIKNSKVLETLGLEKGKYILLSAHREENIDIEENFLLNECCQYHGRGVWHAGHIQYTSQEC